MSTTKIITLAITLIVLGFAYNHYYCIEDFTLSQSIETKRNNINTDSNKNKQEKNKVPPFNNGKIQTTLPVTAENNSLYSDYPQKIRGLLIEITRPLTIKEQQKHQNEVNDFTNLAFSDYNRLPLDTLKEYASNEDGLANYTLSMKNTEIHDINDLENYAIQAIKLNYPAHRSIGLLLSLAPETRSRGLAYLLLAHNQKSISARKQLLHRFNMSPVSTADLEEAMEMVPELRRQLSE